MNFLLSNNDQRPDSVYIEDFPFCLLINWKVGSIIDQRKLKVDASVKDKHKGKGMSVRNFKPVYCDPWTRQHRELYVPPVGVYQWDFDKVFVECVKCSRG